MVHCVEENDNFVYLELLKLTFIIFCVTDSHLLVCNVYMKFQTDMLLRWLFFNDIIKACHACLVLLLTHVLGVSIIR